MVTQPFPIKFVPDYWDVKPAFHLFRKLDSIYTWKQYLSSLETKKALQDYLQKPRWGGRDFPGSPVVKTSRFQGVKVWSLVRELRSYTLNLAEGGEKMLSLKIKPRGVGFGLPRAGIGTQLNWHLIFSFLFPTKLSIKTNTFLSHAQLFFLKVRSPHFPDFDLAKDFKKLSVHSVQLNTSNKSF